MLNLSVVLLCISFLFYVFFSSSAISKLKARQDQIETYLKTAVVRVEEEIYESQN